MLPDRKQKRMFNRRTARRVSRVRDDCYVRTQKVMKKRDIDMTGNRIKIMMAIDSVVRYRILDTINRALKDAI